MGLGGDRSSNRLRIQIFADYYEAGLAQFAGLPGTVKEGVKPLADAVDY